MEAKKNERASAKRMVTVQINTLRQKVAEDNLDNVPKLVEGLKIAFELFSATHHEYMDLCDEDQQEAGDKYFSEVQDRYISVMTECKPIVHASRDKAVQLGSTKNSRVVQGRDFQSSEST